MQLWCLLDTFGVGVFPRGLPPPWTHREAPPARPSAPCDGRSWHLRLKWRRTHPSGVSRASFEADRRALESSKLLAAIAQLDVVERQHMSGDQR
eukprot:1998142-Alexandrium_andersonii.AAC.1